MTNTLNDLNTLQDALKVNLLQVVGTPVLTLLQSEQNAMSQPGFKGLATLQSAWLVFLGQLPLALPNLGFEELKALNAFLIAKLESLMTQATSNTKPS